MTAPFPHHYEARLEWRESYPAQTSAYPRPSILCGPPPQFGGEEGWWSPEHLLLSAANLCLMTTYFALAAKSQIKIERYRSVAKGVLDRGAEGFVFTGIELDVSISVAPADQARAEALIQSAKKYCIISNSLKPQVTVKARIGSDKAG
ncbi:MAG: OsmC family protein [Elusimicrobia bacterium]|nr:OsmC family protein [Elusimicrobiota bacterium]